jgi:GAF domain-containing protein
MNTYNDLRDYLFKDRPGEDPGQRAEILATLAFGILPTLLALLVYRNPITLIAVFITNAIALFVFYQALGGRYNTLILFPVFTSFSVCLVTIVEGDGTHDLLWMGNLGLFLLANIHSRKNRLVPILLGMVMIVMFAFTGIGEINGMLANPFKTTPQYIYLNSFFFAAIFAAIMVVFHRRTSLLQIAMESKSAKIKNDQKLQGIYQTLEERVKQRTHELSETNEQMLQRTTRMQTISEISQDISLAVTQQLNEYLDQTTQIISEKLGFYHVGVFLLNENREYAVLRASNSPGGKLMLERRHQLKVGGTGIVGYVSQGGYPRIALDTGSDAVFFNNPDLPNTRSEMAIPLKYGSRVIGVLDMQSTQPNAFNQEDPNLLSTLANQIAISVHYSLSYEQPGFNNSLQNANQRGDMQFMHKTKQSGYSFHADGTISTATPVDNQLMEKALETGESIIQTQPSKSTPSTLSVPVKFRERVIGIIHIEAGETNRKWTEDEIKVVQSISERAGFALENARLFEETSRRAKQEETIAHITSQIGASTDFNRIMQTTVEELGRTLGATRTFIQLETSTEDGGRTRPPVTD